ncbi:MAG: alpha/beta hydrolase [Verrucomicrobiota bacterium]|jgi:pimeloyl-ACP methyl ester carboxylesterase
MQRIFRVLIIPAIIYGVLCLCVFVWQRKLLFFPTRIPADIIVQVAAEHGFTPWKNPAGQIIGWEIPATGVSTGSVLIVHGNAGCAVGRDYLAKPIHDAESVDVFVLEYPGYGAREGSPDKTSLDASAEAAFQLLPANAPKFLVSESIGAGVACDLAKNHPGDVAGLVLFVPYHNLPSVAQRNFWFLPAYLLMLDRFNPAADLKDYHGPVKFVIAGDDEIIGPASGIKLADAYRGPKNLQIIAGAHHNDVAAQPKEWWRETFAFWRQNKTPR